MDPLNNRGDRHLRATGLCWSSGVWMTLGIGTAEDHVAVVLGSGETPAIDDASPILNYKASCH